jgi:hypothetical protein
MTFEADPAARVSTLAARAPELPVPSALLSVEASSREARRLRGWSSADQALVVGAVQAVLEQWEGAWGVAPEGAVGIHCEAAAEAARQAGWLELRWDTYGSQGENAGLWGALRAQPNAVSLGAARKSPASNAPRRVPQELHVALFNEALTPAGGPSLADELAQAAWQDWGARLASLAAGDRSASPRAATPPAAVLAPWSGALVLTVPWCGTSFILVLTAERIAALLGRPALRTAPAAGIDKRSAPLVPLLHVVKAEPLALRVEMSAVEIDLGTLASLRLGDVVRTSHRLDAPLLMTSAEPEDQGSRTLVCTGFLGRQGERRAIELLPHARPSRT